MMLMFVTWVGIKHPQETESLLIKYREGLSTLQYCMDKIVKNLCLIKFKYLRNLVKSLYAVDETKKQ